MKYFLTIVAIFKNEEDSIGEWINHYLMEGVDHFYLINNGSTDNYQRVTDRYVSRNIVEINTDHGIHMQEKHYNTYYLNRVKSESEWVMVVDLDELIYSRDKFRKISDYLRSLPDNVAQVYVPWKLFGSNGHVKQPSNCIDNFTMRTKYNHIKTNGMIDNENMLTKTLSRTKYLTRMSIHYSITSPIVAQSPIVEITSDGKICGPNQKQSLTSKNISEEILKSSMLHCNHYPIQSFEWFKKIKMSRGSACSANNDKVRTQEYYNSFDSHSNQMADIELMIKRNKLRVYYGEIDVTPDIFQFYVKKENKIIIEEGVVLNNYFGDPQPHVVKYLIIKQNNSLCVYPEDKHGKIIIGGQSPLNPP